jgi:AbrB family looped-hinge helix DNA binding protein
MTTLLKVQPKFQVTIPQELRTRAGLAEGDLIEASYVAGNIVLIPKTVIDRSQFDTATDYTPKQRSIIDARLKKSLAGLAQGRFAGPFTTADEAIAYLDARLAGKKKSKGGTRNTHAS